MLPSISLLEIQNFKINPGYYVSFINPVLIFLVYLSFLRWDLYSVAQASLEFLGSSDSSASSSPNIFTLAKYYESAVTGLLKILWAY
jgi:hypothetical protein